MITAFNNLLATLVLLVLASSFATAYDPSLLQDFCIATNDPSSSVFVNGKFCKNPNDAKVDDFTYSGFDISKNTSNRLGVNVTLLTADTLPSLNTIGLAMGRLDFGPKGLNPPHHHPRGSEILLVLEGHLYVGVITSNPNHVLFSKNLTAGDIFVFPKGLIHFQMNLHDTKAVAIVALNSQNPGVVTEANALFGSSSKIIPAVLAKAFQLGEDVVEELQNKTWQNPSSNELSPMTAYI